MWKMIFLCDDICVLSEMPQNWVFDLFIYETFETSIFSHSILKMRKKGILNISNIKKRDI